MKITERTHVLICKEITKTYLVRIGEIFCLYSVGGGKNLQNSTERMLHMGRQINHEGINNSMMGTETVEPVTQYDILEGQCGAANDKIIVPKEGEIGQIIKLIENAQNPELARKKAKEIIIDFLIHL